LTDTQWPRKINGWISILGDVIGPIFLEGNPTGEKYLAFLENTIQPLVFREIENNDNLTELDEEIIVFQQDCASAHYTITIRDYYFKSKTSRQQVDWTTRAY